MNKTFCVLLCSCLLLASGCATMGKRGSAGKMPSSSVAPAAPPAPAGMRLGNPYYSALGESCYQVLPEGGPSSQARAICLRQGGWELLPQIHMTLAPTPPAPAR